MAKKILIIGRAGVGKTSIKQVIFNGKNPKDLILFPLEPTRGIKTSVYSWLDLDLGLFDSSGQELPFLLEDEIEQNKAFNNSDATIYIFDYLLWVEHSEEIYEEIQKIFNIMNSYGTKTKFVIFFHKIDLFNQKIKGMFQLIETQIKEHINIPIDFKIFFTSLHPNLIYSLYNAFFGVLSGLSTETSSLKDIIDTAIKDYPTTICFITNQHNNIIVQTMTKDFDTNLIRDLHKRIGHLHYTSNDLQIYNRILLIDAGSKILNMILVNLEHLNSDLKFLICMSEMYHTDKLIGLTNNLEKQISNYYKSNKLE